VPRNYTPVSAGGAPTPLRRAGPEDVARLTLPNVPGSLTGRSACFAARGVDLTKIESRPLPGGRGSTPLYLDVAGDPGAEWPRPWPSCEHSRATCGFWAPTPGADIPSPRVGSPWLDELRSRTITEGVQASPTAPCFGRSASADPGFGKPSVGVAKRVSTITPCIFGLDLLAKRAEAALRPRAVHCRGRSARSCADGMIARGPQGGLRPLAEEVEPEIDGVMSSTRCDADDGLAEIPVAEADRRKHGRGSESAERPVIGPAAEAR